MLLLLTINVQKGICYARNARAWMTAFHADIQRGLPPEELTANHGRKLAIDPVANGPELIEMLKLARLGPYRNAPISIADTRVNHTAVR